MKTCRHCGKRKRTAEFPRSKRNRDGFSSWCSDCHNEATRHWREANRERINEARWVVPRYVFDPKSKATVPNPSPRRKSKVR